MQLLVILKRGIVWNFLFFFLKFSYICFTLVLLTYFWIMMIVLDVWVICYCSYFSPFAYRKRHFLKIPRIAYWGIIFRDFCDKALSSTTGFLGTEMMDYIKAYCCFLCDTFSKIAVFTLLQNKYIFSDQNLGNTKESENHSFL